MLGVSNSFYVSDITNTNVEELSLPRTLSKSDEESVRTCLDGEKNNGSLSSSSLQSFESSDSTILSDNSLESISSTVSSHMVSVRQSINSIPIRNIKRKLRSIELRFHRQKYNHEKQLLLDKLFNNS